MRPWIVGKIVLFCLAIGTAVGAAQAAPKFADCPLLGPMPDYEAVAAPDWSHWDQRKLRIDDGSGGDTEIAAIGSVCQQDYAENEGKTEGSILEIIENYKEVLRKLGAEIKREQPGYIVGRLMKDGKETWFNISATRDDGYHVAEIFVEPFKRSLLAPSGNDYRLIGHMPGYVAGQPDKKNFTEYNFPTSDGDLKIRGRYFSIHYDPPEQQPQRKITTMEIIENYRHALHDLGAELLRDDGYDSENVTARFDDHGQLVYLFVSPSEVIAVEEKPFQLTIQPPTVDAMKDKLEKEGHIALYVNFDFAKATLKPDAAPIIKQVIDLMKRNPTLRVSIEGHTDSVGGHDYNVKLSEDRAASVLAAIAAGGIDRARLQSAGFGPDKPVADNTIDEGRAKNRRVELVKAQ